MSKTEQNRLVLTVNCTKRTSVFFQYKQLLKCFVGHFSSVRPGYNPSETKQTLHWSRRWQHSIELHKQYLNKWIVVKYSKFFPRILQKLEHFQLVFGRNFKNTTSNLYFTNNGGLTAWSIKNIPVNKYDKKCNLIGVSNLQLQNYVPSNWN